MSFRRALVLATPILVLLIAWSMSVQPFSGPDEPPHYLRALSIANGQLVGPKVPAKALAYNLRFLSAQSRAWVSHDMREVEVPSAMAPALMTCINGTPDSHGCIETSGTGDYYPLPYLLPAAALAVSSNAYSGLRLARIAACASCWLLLLLSVSLLWNGSFTSLLGLLLALTPMDYYVMSVLNPSGVEISAATAVTASVLRITRDPQHVPRWVWASLAVTAAVTILSWQMGPLYVLFDVLLGLLLLGRAGGERLYGASARAIRYVAVAIVIAGLLWLAYGRIVGVMHSQVQISLSTLHFGISEMPEVLHDAVYGPASQTLPTWVYWVWWATVAGFGVIALVMSAARERAILLLVSAAALAFPIVFFAWAYRFSGFPLAARYVLPILMLIPMLSGELIDRHRRPAGVSVPRASGFPRAFGFVRASGFLRASGFVTLAIVAGVEISAWWEDGRWSSGSQHWLRFFDFASSTPWLGWWPWICLALVGCLGLFAVMAVPSGAGRGWSGRGIAGGGRATGEPEPAQAAPAAVTS